MMHILETKLGGKKLSELEAAYSCLETIQIEIDRLNSSNGIRMEIEMLVSIASETDNSEAKLIMNGIVKVYQKLMLDVNSSFLVAKHKLDMLLLEQKQKKIQ